MKKGLYCKVLAVGIIVMFVGLIIKPCISVNINKFKISTYEDLLKDRVENIYGFIHDDSGYIINNCFINKKENLADINNGYGDIDPLWISNQNSREYYKSIQIYGDYIYAAGYFYDTEIERYSALIGKYNSSDGSEIWKKTWSSYHPDTLAYSITVFNDAIYIVGDSGDVEFVMWWVDAFICKLDLNGNLIWGKVIDENTFDCFYSIKGYDNSLYVCGCKDTILGINSWILEFDTNGNKIWDKSYKKMGAWLSELLDFEIYDGYIYAEGQTDSFDNTAQDVFVLKAALDGTLIWSKEWGGPGPQLGARIDIYNNNVYVCGYGRDEYSYWGGRDLLLKYDFQGNLIWDTSSLCTPVSTYDVICFNGTIYTVGEIWRGYGNGYDTILFKFNEDSELIWYLTYGPYGYAQGDFIDVYEDFLFLVGSIADTSFLLKYDPNIYSDNNRPNKPDRPSGETKIKINQLYTYSSAASDPDGDLLSYSYLWDDGNLTFVEWINSDDTTSASYSWGRIGSYDIKVRARDQYGFVSDWSDPLSVTMSRTRAWFRFIDKFPVMQRILNIL